MALTDLTNTTWTLNSTLTSYAGGTFAMKTYSVDIETETALPAYGGNVDTFMAIRIGYESGNERNQIRVYTSLPESYSNYSSLATGTDTKTLPDTWSSRYEGTFTITGGTDATNSTFIAWIEDNCTQYVPPTPDVVVTYEGANIVELSEAGTKTLKTAGKYLTDDVMLTYSGSSGSSEYIETDPTVPSWAKAASKPTYTASEVGAAATSHSHGNITSGGDITATVAIASGDRLVINDESASKIINSSITFGSNTNQYLANNGTWQTVPSGGGGSTVTVTQTLASGTQIASINVDGTSTTLYAPDGGTEMVVLKYGISTWADFIAAYPNAVVYCRASSNANPASGDQTRMAFMAYVNDEDNPTNVEFQYYRSVSTKSATQQGDQVYIYKLDSSSGWSVTVREAMAKITAGENMTQSYSNGVLTLNAVTPAEEVSISSTQPSADSNLKIWIEI